MPVTYRETSAGEAVAAKEENFSRAGAGTAGLLPASVRVAETAVTMAGAVTAAAAAGAAAAETAVARETAASPLTEGTEVLRNSVTLAGVAAGFKATKETSCPALSAGSPAAVAAGKTAGATAEKEGGGGGKTGGR